MSEQQLVGIVGALFVVFAYHVGKFAGAVKQAEENARLRTAAQAAVSAWNTYGATRETIDAMQALDDATKGGAA